MMISPMLASEVPLTAVGRYVVDDGCVMEQKIDGHRVMLIRPGTDRMIAVGRNGPYTHRLPTAVQKWRLPAGIPENHLLTSMVLDGELLHGEFWAFDLLDANGTMNEWMLEDRRRVLETLAPLTGPFHIVPQARTEQEKTELLMRAASENLEGVMLKRADSIYRCGRRTDAWLKAKFVATADLVVTGIRVDGKASVDVGFVEGDTVRTIGRCSLIGKPPVRVGDVVEVRYLYVLDRDSPRLFQPVLLRVRTDKAAAECTGADLKYANKRVLSSL